MSRGLSGGHLFGDFWNKYQLIIPNSSVRNDEYVEQRYELLRGPYPKFQSQKSKVDKELNQSVLYLFSEKEGKALRLLRLMNVKNINANINVFYFYNRLEKQKARFISYTYEASPEDFIESEEIQKLFQTDKN